MSKLMSTDDAQRLALALNRLHSAHDRTVGFDLSGRAVELRPIEDSLLPAISRATMAVLEVGRLMASISLAAERRARPARKPRTPSTTETA